MCSFVLSRKQKKFWLYEMHQIAEIKEWRQRHRPSFLRSIDQLPHFWPHRYTAGKVMSRNLWSQYDRHVVSISWRDVWN